VTRYAPNAKRGIPLPLQGKIGRVIHSLAKSAEAAPESVREEVTSATLDISEEAVTQFIGAWQVRSAHLPSELVVDPAWGMLLELLQAEIQGRRVSLARLCKVSGVSASNAMRWLKALERRELVVRGAHPGNADKEFVELSQKGSSALRRYFHEVMESNWSVADQR